MKIKCDTEQMNNLAKNIDLQIQKYEEIIKDFYEVVEHFEDYGWVGTSSKNYAKYLKQKKKNYDNVNLKLQNFSSALKENIADIEHAISISGVSEYD